MIKLHALGQLFIVLAVAGTADSIAASCQLTQVADWPVKLIAEHLVVEGAVNGQKVGVMLDTGGISSIPRPAADRMNLTRRLARGYRLFGVGGEGYVESTLIDEFKVGELTRKNWDVMVAGDLSPGPSIDVILGEDVFGQVEVEFDLHHGRVRLFQARGCDGAALGYWLPQGASQVDLERNPQIVVPVKINGQPLNAVLDSGAAFSIIDKPAAARLGIGPESPGATVSGQGGGVGPGRQDLWILPLQSFAIGDETISDTVIRFADPFRDATYTPRSGSMIQQRVEFLPDMLLGADFLRSHRVLVSHSQRKMYFSYEGGPVFQPKTVEASGAPAEQKAPMPSTVPQPSGPGEKKN